MRVLNGAFNKPRDALEGASGQTLADPLKKAIPLASLLLTDGDCSRASDANFKLTVLLLSTKLKQLYWSFSPEPGSSRDF